jgi:hypothetical protein
MISGFTPLRHNGGQAATEFLIAAAFVLVPLFVVIPLIGKYIDIRHSLIQQARYEAWEYTVWYGPDETIMSGGKASQRADQKAWQTTRNEGRAYFFTDPHLASYGIPDPEVVDNSIWVDHHGQSLFVNSDSTISGSQKEADSPDPTAGIIDTVLSGISWITTNYGSLLRHIDSNAGEFDAIYTKGYYQTSPTVSVRSVEMVLPETGLSHNQDYSLQQPLVLYSKAAVLSNYWNAGSRDQAVQEAKGLVFSGILEPVSDLVNGVLDYIQEGINFAEKVLPVDIKLPMMPKFGYVKEDLIPYEHLDESDADGDDENKHELKQIGGLYYYKEE